MKRAMLVLVMFAFALAMPALSGQDPKKAEGVSELMKRKLENSQKVLEGIATNDFGTIAKHANELITISKQAEWKVLKTSDYELYSNDFRRNAEDLVQKAKEKNLDGAALAYVDLTLNCVKCHKHVRETRRVQLDLPDPRLVVRAER